MGELTDYSSSSIAGVISCRDQDLVGERQSDWLAEGPHTLSISQDFEHVCSKYVRPI